MQVNGGPWDSSCLRTTGVTPIRIYHRYIEQDAGCFLECSFSLQVPCQHTAWFLSKLLLTILIWNRFINWIAGQNGGKITVDNFQCNSVNEVLLILIFSIEAPPSWNETNEKPPLFKNNGLVSKMYLDVYRNVFSSLKFTVRQHLLV